MSEWLQSNWHLTAFAVAIVLAVGRSVYHFSKWKRKVDTELKWMRESIDSIDANVSRILNSLPTPKLAEASSPVILQDSKRKFQKTFQSGFGKKPMPSTSHIQS